MNTDSIFAGGAMTRVTSLDTIIVGGGAAAMAAAVSLFDLGVRDIALLIDSPRGSVSRYASSGLQNYYRLADYQGEGDSPSRMARDLSSDSIMDGDLAYTQAVHSLRAFYRLTSLGVSFPVNSRGEYVSPEGGNKKSRRQISAGPDTAGEIYKKLSAAVAERNIRVYTSMQMVRLLTDPKGSRAVGLIALNLEKMNERHQRFTLFNCRNIVLATGGPGGVFHSEAAPVTHSGAHGAALRAGARAMNLTELDLGICAVRKCLCMNGPLQEAVPRYVSVDANGKNPREFLYEAFSENPDQVYRLQKRKGAEWSFDAKKARSDGSSLIDLLVYQEIRKGRHVFMDYRVNPRGLEAQDLPYQRLRKLSEAVWKMLLKAGIDLSRTAVEVAPEIRSYHGGLWADEHFESNITHLYPVGEAASRLGVYGPDGASLSATQTSASAAALAIVSDRRGDELLDMETFASLVKEPLTSLQQQSEQFLSSLGKSVDDSQIGIRVMRSELGRRMDQAALVIRDTGKITAQIEVVRYMYEKLPEIAVPSARQDLAMYFQIQDLLLTDLAFLSAMISYKEKGGKSRGGFIIPDPSGMLPSSHLSEEYRYSLSDAQVSGKIQETAVDEKTLSCSHIWREKKPVNS